MPMAMFILQILWVTPNLTASFLGALTNIPLERSIRHYTRENAHKQVRDPSVSRAGGLRWKGLRCKSRLVVTGRFILRVHI